MNDQSKKILCLCPIFGNKFLVDEYSVILRNWSENKYIDFIIFTDHYGEFNEYASNNAIDCRNIKFVEHAPCTVIDNCKEYFKFNVLKHFKDSVKATYHHYLCDLKPFYHIIFKEYIDEKYEYFGFLDYDTVISSELDIFKTSGDCDVFNIKKYIGGPCGFYKNKQNVKNIINDILNEYSINDYFGKYKTATRYDEANNENDPSFKNGLLNKIQNNKLSYNYDNSNSHVISHEILLNDDILNYKGNNYDMVTLQSYLQAYRKN